MEQQEPRKWKLTGQVNDVGQSCVNLGTFFGIFHDALAHAWLQDDGNPELLDVWAEEEKEQEK